MGDDNGSLVLAMFAVVLFSAWLKCVFWTLGDTFHSKHPGGGAKALWVSLVVLIRWVGIVV